MVSTQGDEGHASLRYVGRLNERYGKDALLRTAVVVKQLFTLRFQQCLYFAILPMDFYTDPPAA